MERGTMESGSGKKRGSLDRDDDSANNDHQDDSTTNDRRADERNRGKKKRATADGAANGEESSARGVQQPSPDGPSAERNDVEDDRGRTEGEDEEEEGGEVDNGDEEVEYEYEGEDIAPFVSGFLVDTAAVASTSLSSPPQGAAAAAPADARRQRQQSQPSAAAAAVVPAPPPPPPQQQQQQEKTSVQDDGAKHEAFKNARNQLIQQLVSSKYVKVKVVKALVQGWPDLVRTHSTFDFSQDDLTSLSAVITMNRFVNDASYYRARSMLQIALDCSCPAGVVLYLARATPTDVARGWHHPRIVHTPLCCSNARRDTFFFKRPSIDECSIGTRKGDRILHLLFEARGPTFWTLSAFRKMVLLYKADLMEEMEGQFRTFRQSASRSFAHLLPLYYLVEMNSCGRYDVFEHIRTVLEIEPQTAYAKTRVGALTPFDAVCLILQVSDDDMLRLVHLLAKYNPSSLNLDHLDWVAKYNPSSLNLDHLDWLMQRPDSRKTFRFIVQKMYYPECTATASSLPSRILGSTDMDGKRRFAQEICDALVQEQEEKQVQWLPIQAAMADNRPPSIVLIMARTFSDTLAVANLSDPSKSTALCDLCKHLYWMPSEELRHLITRASPTAPWSLSGRREQRTPGELACYVKTQKRQLPLHISCFTNWSVDYTKILVRANPDSVKEADIYGNLPLHIACSQVPDPHKCYDHFIQDERSHHLSAENRYDEVFIVEDEEEEDKKQQIADSCHSSNIQYLCDMYPDAVRIHNRDGYLPLHYACRYGKLSIQNAQYMVDQFIESVQPALLTVDWMQDTPPIPLQQNIEASMSKKSPPKEWVCPVFLAAANKHSSLDVIYYLVRACPHAILTQKEPVTAVEQCGESSVMTTA